jgi:hypothetical protein
MLSICLVIQPPCGEASKVTIGANSSGVPGSRSDRLGILARIAVVNRNANATVRETLCDFATHSTRD